MGIYVCLYITSSLFIFGMIGIILHRKNLIIILICLELLLLAANLNIAIVGAYRFNITGLIFFLLILTVAAAESAIGLAILMAYYRVKGSIAIKYINSLKG